MYSATSQTVSEDYKAEKTESKEWRYQIANGNTAEITISDPLLDTEAAARERAMSEFLKNSYRLREISFKTHLSSIGALDIINVRGLPYIVKSITVSGDKTKIVFTVKAVRYE